MRPCQSQVGMKRVRGLRKTSVGDRLIDLPDEVVQSVAIGAGPKHAWRARARKEPDTGNAHIDRRSANPLQTATERLGTLGVGFAQESEGHMDGFRPDPTGLSTGGVKRVPNL